MNIEHWVTVCVSQLPDVMVETMEDVVEKIALRCSQELPALVMYIKSLKKIIRWLEVTHYLLNNNTNNVFLLISTQ